MHSDTEILIQSLKNNSIRAFDALYQIYSARLYHFVMKISNRDSYISEEIVQRVFIKIWEERNGLDSQKSFNSYICTIAKNMLMNEYKETLGLAKEAVEITKELKRDCEGLNIDYTDILEKMNFWKNKANKLHKQVKYLQRKCKNNNTK